MRNLWKVKSWFSVDDAAKRLSISLGEEIKARDIFYLVNSGHLDIYCLPEHMYFEFVVPYCFTIDYSKELLFLFSKGEEISNDRAKDFACEPGWKWLEEDGSDSESQHYFRLAGDSPPLKLELEMSSYLAGWIRALEKDKEDHYMHEYTCIDGYFLSYQDTILRPIDHEKEIGHYPSAVLPEVEDLMFSRESLENLEAMLSEEEAGARTSKKESGNANNWPLIAGALLHILTSDGKKNGSGIAQEIANLKIHGLGQRTLEGAFAKAKKAYSEKAER